MPVLAPRCDSIVVRLQRWLLKMLVPIIQTLGRPGQGDFCEFKVKPCSEFQTVLESETLSRFKKKMACVRGLSYLKCAEITEFVNMSFTKCELLFLPFSFYLSF